MESLEQRQLMLETFGYLLHFVNGSFYAIPNEQWKIAQLESGSIEYLGKEYQVKTIPEHLKTYAVEKQQTFQLFFESSTFTFRVTNILFSIDGWVTLIVSLVGMTND